MVSQLILPMNLDLLKNSKANHMFLTISKFWASTFYILVRATVLVYYSAKYKCAHFMFSTDRYDKIPSYIEARLLPFQRDGVRYVRVFPAKYFYSSIQFRIGVCVLKFSDLNIYWSVPSECHLNIGNLHLLRFVLQHGGRVLLADEMGLGKTLQVLSLWLRLRFIPCVILLNWSFLSK